ncbi:MAG: TonB-dependent receptor [Bacteroidetes bacterium]|nr:MAG: TonB-dependent receptor [Bacteroidota bacterium]
MYRWLWLALLLSWSAGSLAQVLEVRDAETGLPLEAVTVMGQPSGGGTLTDKAGRADLRSLVGSDSLRLRLLGYHAQTLAYETLAAAGWQARLQPDPLALDQVILSAHRWEEARQRQPARISTLSPQEIALQNPQTAADLLGASGEVFIQKSQQGGGSPMIRGFSTNRLLYTVDGVRMNTAIFRGGNLQNVISLDPLAMRQVEVLFGPGAIVYGSDAIGGVMSFHTLRPRLSAGDSLETGASALLRYATANQERTAHAHVSVSGRRWAALTSLTTTAYGDLRMGRHGPGDYLRPWYVQRLDSQDVRVLNPDPLVQTPTGYEQINLMQKVRFQPHRDWEIDYGFHFSTTTDYDRYDRLLRERGGQPRSAEWRYGPQVWMMSLLKLTHQGNTPWYDELALRLAHQHFAESRIDRDFGDIWRRTRAEQVAAWSLNLDLTKGLAEQGRLFYGLEGVRNGVSSEGQDTDIRTGQTVGGPSRYPQADWTSLAVYASVQLNLRPGLTLQAGGRYSWVGLQADFRNNLPFFPFPQTSAALQQGAPTGNLGLVWHPGRAWTLTAQVATGFRAPNVDDMGKVFDSEPGAVVIPNPDLRAEYAYHAEFGIARVLGDWLKLEASAFYTHLDGALVRRDFRLNDQDSLLYAGELSRIQAIQNAAVARVYGLQVGLEAVLPAGLRLSSRYNVQIGEEELDDGSRSPARHAAPAFGVTRLSYRQGPLLAQVYAQYSAARAFEQLPQEEQAKDFLYALDAEGRPYQPAWYTLNLKLAYQLDGHWSLTAGAENLTDQRYRPYSSGLTAPGRQLILALRANF